ncbi:hypothetical protein [Mycoplasma todarodis]|uniref:hypothetical protein n=1 Tax=Mycoplasma todarodis TaxID=1937191 RepID=UPI003B2FAAA8
MKTNNQAKIQEHAIKLNNRIGLHTIFIPIISLLLFSLAITLPISFHIFYNKLTSIYKWQMVFWILLLTTIFQTLQILWLVYKHFFTYKRIFECFGDSKENVEIILKHMNWPSLDADEDTFKLHLKKIRFKTWRYITPISFIWVALFSFDLLWGGALLFSNRTKEIKKKIQEEIQNKPKE